MIKPSATPRAVGKWIAITSAIVALGCPPPVGHLPPPDWSTPLPPGVDSDAATFRMRVATFRRTGTYHVRARAARCSLGSLCAVEVRIEPLGDTQMIDPDSAPAMGVAVARIENLDPVDVEALYGFRPGVQDVYYLWVDRKPRSVKARWTVLQVPMGAGIVTAGYQKDLRLCHPRTPGEIRMSDADFSEYRYHGPCTAVATAEKASINQASLLPTERLVAFVGRVAAFFRGELTAQGGWISCSAGCCT